MMGAAGAKMREAIVEALLNFLKRMPGIESYRFANDMPFASAETLAWIQQCQQAGQAALPNDALGQAQSQAQSQQVEGNTEAATTALQTFINSSRSGRDRFRARLALLDVLLADSARIDLQPLIDPITANRHPCSARPGGQLGIFLSKPGWPTQAPSGSGPV